MALGKQKMECFESDPEGDAYVEPPIRKVGGASDKKEDKGDVVVQTKINPSLAFEAFAGKLYETSDRDFSDSSLRAQVRKVSTRPELEYTPALASKKHFESPLDRYYRLKHDIQTFQQELTELAQQGKKSGKDGSEDPLVETARVLSADTSTLESELNAIASDKELGPYVQQSYPVRPSLLQQSHLVDRLVLQLKKLQQTSASGESKSSTPSGAKPKSEKDGTPSSVTYELYLPSTSAPDDGSEQSRQQHLVALDRRLALLEQRLGVGIGSTLTSRTPGATSSSTFSSTSSTSSSTLSSSLLPSTTTTPEVSTGASTSTTPSGAVVGFPDVLSGLAILQSKLDLLDPTKLEALSRRIRGLTEDMELLQQHREALKKTASSAATTGTTSSTSASTSAPHDKIEALWNLMSRWDSAIGVLPQLISRLQSLRFLHEDSAQAASRLQAVESKHATMVDLLQQDQAALQKVSESMESNVKILEKNVLLLQNRLNAVSEKFAAAQQPKGKPKS